MDSYTNAYYSPEAQEIVKMIFMTKGHRKIESFREELLKECLCISDGNQWNKCIIKSDGTVDINVNGGLYYWICGWLRAGGAKLWATWYKDMTTKTIKIQVWKENPASYLKRTLEEKRPDIIVASVMTT